MMAPGTVGLILGRASLTLQGLIVLPGIIDAQHSPRLQVLASSPRGVFSITKGDRIAQALLLPGIEPPRSCSSKPIGSTGTDSAFLMIPLDDRPKLALEIQGKTFEGILDTGADRSIISSHWWPKKWPINTSAHSLQGLGYQSNPNISSSSLKWVAPDKTTGFFTPYVLPLPVNLWGRDVLHVMGFTLTNDHMAPQSSPPVQRMLTKMGYTKGKGLGKYNQGIVEPIPSTIKLDKKGLGFS